MAQLILPYPDFMPNTKIISAQVDANNTAITNLLNGNLAPDNLLFPFLATGTLGADKSGTATAVTQGYNSRDLVLRGSGWDGTAAQDRDFILRQVMTSATAYQLGIYKKEGAVETLLASLDQAGGQVLSGYLTVGDAFGFTIGAVANQNRITFGQNSATAFTLIKADSNFAGLYAADATFAGELKTTHSYLTVAPAASGAVLNLKAPAGYSAQVAWFHGGPIKGRANVDTASNDLTFNVATGAAGSEVYTESFRIVNATGILQASKQIAVLQTTNTPGLLLQGATAGWASGLQLNNTTASTGRKYGMYSDSTGNLVISDETALANRVRLRANGIMEALVGFAHRTKAGAPTDADFATPPSDGTIVIDTTNSRIYARIGGVWKYVAVA